MLLKEDGHLDIEKVERLSGEELEEEMDSWGASQFCEWVGRNGTMTHEEVFGYIYQKINEAFAQNRTNKKK